MRRVAILHFTLDPAIGGIEQVIRHQTQALLRQGCEVTLVAGSGSAVPGTDIIIVPAMLPTQKQSGAEAPRSVGSEAFRDHPITSTLVNQLFTALGSCTDCWVHNVFSIDLNPYLRAALLQLAVQLTHLRWVAWCEDVSGSSEYVQDRDEAWVSEIGAALNCVQVVTISEHRKQQLCRLYGLCASDVQVIQPPLDASQWLDLGPQSRMLLTATDLANCTPSVFVPAKALPHKNLERTLDLASGLIQAGARPVLILSGATSMHEPDVSTSVLDALIQKAQKRGLSRSVVVASRLLGETLSARTIRELMLLVDVLFVPSREEGFGLPLLEAAMVRLPILCAEIPSFREVLGEAGCYFSDTASTTELAACAQSLANSGGNLIRRRALASLDHFAHELQSLLQ